MGELQYDHYLCTPHKRIKPHYKDLFLKNRTPKILDTMEKLILKEFGPHKAFPPQTGEFSFGKMLFDTTVTYLPAPIAEYLYEQYACSKDGSEILKPGNFNSVCKICLSAAKTTLKRKVLERQLLLKYQNQETPKFYAIIPTSWLINWKIF